jgi:outer membrane lipoprotein SlyB
MNKFALTTLLAASLMSLSVGASATDLSGAGFTSAQLRSGLDVFQGTLTNLLVATENKTEGGNNLGTGIGAVAGGIAGNAVGPQSNGAAKALTTLTGAVLGGLLGHVVTSAGQTSVCTQTFVVHFDRPVIDNGVQKDEMAYAQECAPLDKNGQPLYSYAIGQKVQVLIAKLDRTARVVPAQ